MFGLENKVQSILLIGALPLIMLPFGGADSARVAFWRNTTPAWLATIVAAIAAGAELWAAWPLIVTGFDHALLDAAQFRPLLMGRYGVAQVALGPLVGARG